MALLALTAGACAGHRRPADDNESRARASAFRTSQKADKTDFATADVLAQFEGAPDDLYRLGPGDAITVDVWGRPDLSGKHVVGPDGRITLAVAGPLRVVDLSSEAAAAVITRALSPYYLDLAVTVRIDQYVSNQVVVLGRVAKPGALQFESPPTLLDALARAGTLPVGGIGAEKAALTRCAVFRGRDRILWIDLKSLLTGTNLALNIRLRRNDLVYLPDADDQLVYVLGEVHKPGALRLTPDMSFLDALAQAGGPTPDAAPDKLHLVRPAMRLERDIDLGDILHGDPELNLVIEEGDILYVPRNGIAKVGYVLQKLSPITGLLIFGSAVAP